MKAFVAIAMLMVTAAVLASAIGAGASSPPDHPPGVAATNWVPISDSLGVVLVHAKQVPTKHDATALLVMPPEQGYLVMKRGSRWLRLELVEPVKGPGVAG